MPDQIDQEEFVRLLTEHQASLRAYIYSLMPGKTGVNDVLQETNITLWKKRERFQIGTNFTAWSFAVARYSVLEFRRKARGTQELSFNDELMDLVAFSPDELRPDSCEARYFALKRCLELLSPTHRELIDLRYEKETTIEEFARSQGKSAGSIRVALYQIRAALRKCINERLKEIPPTA